MTWKLGYRNTARTASGSRVTLENGIEILFQLRTWLLIFLLGSP